MTAIFKTTFVAAGLTVAAFSSAGVLLTAGSTIALPIETYSESFTALEDEARAFSIVNAASQVRATGTVRNIVLRETATNTITFVYQVRSDSTSLDEINRFTVTGFAGWTATVSQDWLAPERKITLATRSSSGDVLGGSFVGSPLGLGTLAPGERSAFFVVRTNATDYTRSTLNVIDGGIATVESFAPVPEPGTMAALGLGALVALRRRKKA